jgi:hypothetical protein
MSPSKQPLNFAGRRPGALPPTAAAKLAELENRAEARGNGVAGYAPQEPETVAASPEAAPTPATSKRRPSLPAGAARSGTQADPYVRADGLATRATTVHLPIDLHQQLRMEAARRGVHMSAIITEAVTGWFAGRG